MFVHGHILGLSGEDITVNIIAVRVSLKCEL